MYDPMARRASVRKGRERGCWVYIPREELDKTRLASVDAPPFYRTVGRKDGATVVVLLFPER